MNSVLALKLSNLRVKMLRSSESSEDLAFSNSKYWLRTILTLLLNPKGFYFMILLN